MLHPHHHAALERFIEHYTQNPEVQAIVVGGSLAKGFGKASSDLDVLIVIDEAQYTLRKASQNLSYYSEDFTDYEGGYVDGKHIGLSFLQQVAEKGSEPARAAFWKSFIAWSRHDPAELQVLLDRITTYPEAGVAERIHRFMAQVQAMHWYVGEGEKHDNPYLLNWSATRAVLFTSRMLLAHNRLFFPYHKWMLKMLELAPDVPDSYLQKADQLMRHPSVEGTRELCDLVLQFRDWGTPSTYWTNFFLQDSELNWLTGHTPIEDL
ncbi:nucleotidyltransferase domain-containing protein [Deinococcus roseus]|uniref:Polymerase nucleotidyl transferase domain-containing protein n=1 Tax=Deinococcus roseus TaxID=392414 RepID=A0ABQ2CYR9_9DEIO|nr:nucleotidyltransferase domain-containing protein [Deinococcus roseus]GGJ32477.1 hypothetical protein GCM10008938_18380 [Deinococcus roseus]